MEEILFLNHASNVEKIFETIILEKKDSDLEGKVNSITEQSKLGVSF